MIGTNLKIYEYINSKEQVSINELVNHFHLSRQSINTHLKNLVESRKVIKLGSPPKVMFAVSTKHKLKIVLKKYHVELSHGKQLSLKNVSRGDESYFQRILFNKKNVPRQKLILIILNQLLDSNLNIEDLEALSDVDLIKSSAVILKSLDESITNAESMSIDEQITSYEKYFEERMAKIAAVISKSIPKIEISLPKFDFGSVFDTSFISSIKEATRAIESISEITRTLEKIVVPTIPDLVIPQLPKFDELLIKPTILEGIESIQLLTSSKEFTRLYESIPNSSLLKAAEKLSSISSSETSPKLIPSFIRHELPLVVSSDKDPIYNKVAYEYLYELESILRKFIHVNILVPFNNNLFRYIPEEMLDDWALKKLSEEQNKYVEAKSYGLIEYSDFTQLKVIFEKRTTKNALRDKLNEQEIAAITLKLHELGPIRIKVAHSRNITKDEFDTLVLYSRRIKTVLNKLIP